MLFHLYQQQATNTLPQSRLLDAASHIMYNVQLVASRMASPTDRLQAENVTQIRKQFQKSKKNIQKHAETFKKMKKMKKYKNIQKNKNIQKMQKQSKTCTHIPKQTLLRAL